MVCREGCEYSFKHKIVMQKNLILIGGGGHCKSVIDVAESAGYNILGILDLSENVGKQIFDYSVIGTDEDISNYVGKAEFVITVGFIRNPAIRIALYDKIIESGGKLATIVASTAYVSKYATLGKGTVIMHNAFVNAGAQIGDNCIINTLTNIEHDVRIGQHCHISTGAMVNGDCTIGEKVFIGSQAVLSNSITVGEEIIVSAGAFVYENISVKGLYYGNPARLKEILK
jgi:sugar O-acyltransferase (sialic acid O-acetyltransferase NeuD family)